MPQRTWPAWRFALLLCNGALAVGACGGGRESGPPAASPRPLAYDVYVSGYHNVREKGRTRFFPCYWKNGTRTDLGVPPATDGLTTQLLVSGTDSYVAGATRSAGGQTYHPCYWKNGERTVLSELDARQERPAGDRGVFQVASGIGVSGSDVYVCGRTTSSAGGLVACYWRNGARTDLVEPNNKESHASMIQVLSGEVFVAGRLTSAAGVVVPCYWRNGVRVGLSVLDATQGGAAGSIEAKGGAVHVSGTTRSSSGQDLPCYWRNGARADLPMPERARGGDAVRVRVDGQDVYVAGYVGSGRNVPCYWKNGVRVDLPLPGGSKSGAPQDLAIAGNSVYVVGTVYDAGDVAYPCYWKDGVPHTLADPGWGHGLQVVAR